MTDLKPCIGDSLEQFNSQLLSVENFSKWKGNSPKGTFFAKTEGKPPEVLIFNSIKQLSWNSVKGKIYATFSKVTTVSHASLALINFKLESDESVTLFIYR